MSRYFYRASFLTSIIAVASASAQHTSTRKSTLRHEGLIDAPVQEVWKAFTTNDGLKSWMAPLADIDLRVGGKMRVNYSADGVLGDEKTIENTILSYEPQRMFSIQATKPPAGFPFPTAIKSMWTVLYFEPIGADRTRVTITGMGFDDSDESLKMREFFDKGNAHTLEQLRKKFARGRGAAENNALKVLLQLVGGEWIFENKREDGGIFRGRNMTELGPDSKSLLARGWLGNSSGMSFHAATQIWLEPDTNTVRFQNLDEQSGLATGEIVPIGDNAVSWDWNASMPGGRKLRYRVDMVFADADHYEFILHEVKADGLTTERVRVNYARVSEAPEEFRKIRQTKE
jgi:uncharacterized protein YndB with AHSA1/START domain